MCNSVGGNAKFHQVMVSATSKSLELGSGPDGGVGDSEQ